MWFLCPFCIIWLHLRNNWTGVLRLISIIKFKNENLTSFHWPLLLTGTLFLRKLWSGSEPLIKLVSGVFRWLHEFIGNVMRINVTRGHPRSSEHHFYSPQFLAFPRVWLIGGRLAGSTSSGQNSGSGCSIWAWMDSIAEKQSHWNSKKLMMPGMDSIAENKSNWNSRNWKLCLEYAIKIPKSLQCAWIMKTSKLYVYLSIN